MRLQSVIRSPDVGRYDHIMWAPEEEDHRLALIEALDAAREESKRLAEMITLLKSAPHMNAARVGVLTLEWKVARDRTLALETEMKACMSSSNEPTGKMTRIR